jgi:NitT/TauT family transport system substrate-binding protein
MVTPPPTSTYGERIMLKRRSFLATSAAAVAATAAGLPALAQTAPKILVGYWPVAAALPFFVMEHNDYFKDAGVDVELVKFLGSGEGDRGAARGAHPGDRNRDGLHATRAGGDCTA